MSQARLCSAGAYRHGPCPSGLVRMEIGKFAAFRHGLYLQNAGGLRDIPLRFDSRAQPGAAVFTHKINHFRVIER